MTDNTFTRMDLAQFDGHTPGPWREHDADVTTNGHRIKLRYEAPSDNKLMPIGDFTRTLHLIAAAPCLLAALRAAYADIDRLQSQLIAVQEDAMTIYGDNDRLTAEIDRLTADVEYWKQQQIEACAEGNGLAIQCEQLEAERDRLRANALEWVTVTDDPATLPPVDEIVVIRLFAGGTYMGALDDFSLLRWQVRGPYLTSFQVVPGDRWAYIPEAPNADN